MARRYYHEIQFSRLSDQSEYIYNCSRAVSIDDRMMMDPTNLTGSTSLGHHQMGLGVVEFLIFLFFLN